jgi:hypothetical protein
LKLELIIEMEIMETIANKGLTNFFFLTCLCLGLVVHNQLFGQVTPADSAYLNTHLRVTLYNFIDSDVCNVEETTYILMALSYDDTGEIDQIFISDTGNCLMSRMDAMKESLKARLGKQFQGNELMYNSVILAFFFISEAKPRELLTENKFDSLNTEKSIQSQKISTPISWSFQFSGLNDFLKSDKVIRFVFPIQLTELPKGNH